MDTITSDYFINHYDEVSEQLNNSKKYIYISNNGRKELVAMSINEYERRQQLLKIKEDLLEIKAEQLNGAKYYSLEELELELNKLFEC